MAKAKGNLIQCVVHITLSEDFRIMIPMIVYFHRLLQYPITILDIESLT